MLVLELPLLQDTNSHVVPFAKALAGALAEADDPDNQAGPRGAVQFGGVRVVDTAIGDEPTKKTALHNPCAAVAKLSPGNMSATVIAQKGRVIG